jgi:hypothetical protein
VEDQNLELVTANIVLLATSHNPSVLSAEWLKNCCGVEEKPTNLLSSAELFFLDSEATQIMCEPNRLQIISKRPLGEFNPASVVSKYVENLPHIKYGALGLNYVWRIPTDADRLKFGMTANGKVLPDKFDSYAVEFGGILYFHADGDVCKVVIDKPNPKLRTLNINFHFETADKGLDYLKGKVALYETHKQFGKRLVGDYFKSAV